MTFHMWTCFSYIQQKWYNSIHPSSVTICWQPTIGLFKKPQVMSIVIARLSSNMDSLFQKQWGIQDDVVFEKYVLDFFSARKSWISSRTHLKGMSNWVGFPPLRTSSKWHHFLAPLHNETDKNNKAFDSTGWKGPTFWWMYLFKGGGGVDLNSEILGFVKGDFTLCTMLNHC